MHSGSFKTSGFTVRSILRVPGTSIRSRTLPKWIPVFGKQDRPFGLKHRHFILPASITLQRFASAPSITLPIMSLTPPTATLAEFLQNQKSRYLKDVEEGKGGEWTVVMGNEAGDLDSMASAIALAWCMSTVDKVNAISLIQTPRADLHLREENLYALSLAGIDTKEPQFLCVDDVPTSTPFPSRNFALVDHNRLAPQFTLENPEAKVVSVIDHHEDEGLYKETASPRTITVPTGSATSLVALYLREKSADGVPPELATLLLCGILIDTDGLKPGGKAEKKDREAAPFLVPRSLLPPAIEEKDLPDDPRINDLTSSLDAKKGDVSHLDTRDLLRRDYKEYTMIPSWAKDKTVLVGLASVPVGLKAWLTRDDGFFTATDKWMSDRGLSAIGILTSFHDEKKLNKQGKPKHKREQIWVVRKGENELKDLNKTLFKGIKKSKELKPNEKSFKWDYGVRKGAGFDKTVKAKVYRQGVVRANRKVTAPVVKNIIEGSTS